jgi:LysR family transcriptional regulator, nod-box dependent transcriptional activator
VARAKSPDEEEDWSPARRLNLNLLYPLDAILNAPSLTEAGRRSHLSQPAMSHALKRLRDHFGDDLVAFSSGDRTLTALGEVLRPEIRRVMREVEGAFNLEVEFDPRTTTRDVTIATSEMIEHMMLAPLLRELSRQAPDASFRVVPLDTSAPERSLELGADIILLQAHFASGRLETRRLSRDGLSCLMRVDHPALGSNRRISPDSYEMAHHVIALADSVVVTPSDAAGERLLAQRKISIRATSQAAIPWYLLKSDLIATGSSWLFQTYASMLPLIVVPPPFPAHDVTVVAQWASYRGQDPLVTWLVESLAQAVPEPLRD